MPQVKIATFNTEWMVSLFGGLWTTWVSPTIPHTFPGRSLGDIRLEPIEDVPALCERLAGVIKVETHAYESHYFGYMSKEARRSLDGLRRS